MQVSLSRFRSFRFREITDFQEKLQHWEELLKALPGCREFFKPQVSDEPEKNCLVSMNSEDCEGQTKEHLVFWAPCYQPGWCFTVWQSQRVSKKEKIYHLYLVSVSLNMRSLKNPKKFLRKIAYSCIQICHIKVKSGK